MVGAKGSKGRGIRLIGVRPGSGVVDVVGVACAAVRPLAATVLVGLSLAALAPRTAAADTLEWALVQAYQNNPQLNAQRAALRAQDETVPQALSGYRPKVALTASVASQFQSTLSKNP